MTRCLTNPFPLGDADRHEIWEMAVARDIDAFINCDWSKIQDDFEATGFVGQAGSSNPDHWYIKYPTLEAYKTDWIQQAEAFDQLQLRDVEKTDFLFCTTILRDIDINEDQAIAHKKFDGRANTVSGDEIVLQWQTMYWLRRIEGKWKFTGFLGYLPNPMPRQEPRSQPLSIQLPPNASQHTTAGPYSPVLKVTGSGLVVISGQGPIDGTGNIIGSTIQDQTRLTFENCKRQLAVAGVGLSDVFKVVVYLSDIAEWAMFNEVYRDYFQSPYPVRTAIQAILWGGIKVEIDMIAISQ